jgi:hypothetical protein
MRVYWVAAWVVLSPLVWSGCRPSGVMSQRPAAAQTPGRPAGTEELLRLGLSPIPYRYTDDGCHVLMLVSREGQLRPTVYLDERELLQADVCSDAAFSPDGTKVAWVALVADGEHVYVNEQAQPQIGTSVHSMRWSPDSEHIEYLVVRDHRKWLAIDHALVQPMPEGFKGVVWVPGSPLVYAFPDGDRDGQWIVTAHGRGPVFQAVSRPVAGRRNGALAYVATVNGEMRVVRDGRLEPPYASLDPDSLVFSADGRHLAYRVGPKGAMRVVADGVPGESFDEVRSGSLGFTGGGATVRYVAREGERMYVLIGAETGPAHEHVGEILCDPGENHIAYCAGDHFETGVMLDHSLIGEPQFPPGPGSLTFSPHGAHLAHWGTERGKYGILIDGQRRATEEGPPEHLVFSPDGHRTAFACWVGAGTGVVVDGERQGPWKTVEGEISFSPDSRHVAYAITDGVRHAVVVNGRPGEWFDRMWVRGPRFNDDGSLEYLAVRDWVLYRVTWRAPEA